jgi:hypothetical protein
MRHKRPSPFIMLPIGTFDARDIRSVRVFEQGNVKKLQIVFASESDFILDMDGDSGHVYARRIHDAREAYWRSRG